MNPSGRLTLQVRIPGIEAYEIGDEIWQQSLAEAIEAEADAIAMAAGAELLPDPSDASRAGLRARVIAEMTDALTVPGDRYTAPDGVSCALTEESALAASRDEDRLSAMGSCTSEPVVEAVLRFENLPTGPKVRRSSASRSADSSPSAAKPPLSLNSCPPRFARPTAGRMAPRSA